jgi:xanthine dehydrogenase small subunit
MPSDAVIKTYKLAKRVDQDISTVSAAFYQHGDTIRAAFGGVAATPVRATHFEQALQEGGFEAAIVALSDEISPMSDARGSAEYRRLAAANLARRFYHEVLAADAVETRLEALS